jgi:hypothetical protein
MATETLKLIATAAGQISRSKGTVMKSRDSIERCRRLLKGSRVRCEKRLALRSVKVAGHKITKTKT